MDPTPSSSLELVCAFCGKRPRDARNLIAGPSAQVCDACVTYCAGLVAANATVPKPEVPPAFELSCSFCRKPRSEVDQLVVGPKIDLCDACVRLCADKIVERNKPKPEPVRAPAASAAASAELARVQTGIEYLLLRSAPTGSWKEVRIHEETGEIWGSNGGEKRPVTRAQPPLPSQMIAVLRGSIDSTGELKIQVRPYEHRSFKVRFEGEPGAEIAIVTTS